MSTTGAGVDATGTPGLAQVLVAREERARRQRDLIAATDCPVLSLTMVSPGPVKCSRSIERVFAAAATVIGVRLADSGWPVVARAEVHAITGPELQWAVRAPASRLKAAMVELEERNPWGRLWDIDVVVADGPLARTEGGAPPRRCLVCDDPAVGCARSRRHVPEAVAAAVAVVGSRRPGRPPSVALGSGPRRFRTIGALAAEALRVEARLAPKPGLVDALDSGAHADMDVHLLLRSADVLEPWFTRMAELGGQPCWSVDQLRELGRGAESAMLAATSGVNTHRGAIFVVGWICAVAGGAPSVGEVWGAPDRVEPLWSARIRRLASPLLKSWLSRGDVGVTSNGERVHRAHGLLGARGEAGSGLSSVLLEGLPRYRQALDRGWADDDALLLTLVGLMARTDDTTLVSRGGIGALRSVQAWAGDLLAADPGPAALKDALGRANGRFSRLRWSAGGSADLLSATWLLDQLERAEVWAQGDAAQRVERPRAAGCGSVPEPEPAIGAGRF